MTIWGSSTFQACYYPDYFYIYQETSYFAVGFYKYRTGYNCSNSTCDWAGLYSYMNYSGTYQLNYTCGDISTFVSCSYSDVTLKSGIETLTNALSNIMNIEAVEYDWNDKLNATSLEYFKKQQKLHTIGLIAQNVRLYYPEVVSMNPDGYYSIDYKKLNAVLVEGIKEQEVFIEDIDKQLEYIESKLN